MALSNRLTLLIVLFLLPIPGQAQTWWDCDWEYRFPATITKPPGPALIDFQVRLNLDAGNVPAEFDWSRLGDDVRILDEDDLTVLDFFVEAWDSVGETATLWVSVPLIPGGGHTLYIYFVGPPATPPVSTPAIFTEPGLKFQTKRTTADPTDRASAEAAFAAANGNAGGYGCTFINDYTGVTNLSLFSPPPRNGQFGLLAEVFFEVTPAEAGVWQFRYGADFGRGGGLYVDDIALDEKWNTDLWWANNWNNTSEILQGSINLAPGTHSFRILGFEGCCDGGLTAQFTRPGGAWQAMSLANIALSSRACTTNGEPAVAFGPVEIRSCPVVSLDRTTQTYADPFNNTVNPYAIPGATILNTTTVTNSGVGPVDADSVEITEALATDVALRVSDFGGGVSGPVQFVDGTPASGLSYSFIALGDPGDDVSFSSDGGGTYNYTPVPDATGVDLNITHFRITPGGALVGNSGAGDPSASFSFMTVVQ